jgi:single-stranded-DNA-specific exonuclease
MTDSAQARSFLSPSLDLLHDPMLMRDMDRAVYRLHRAIESKEKILVYGDYDVDGTSSIVILKKAVELLGGDASFHVPHRLTDGYGMRAEVIVAAAEAGVTLIVSVDTGIRANTVVRQANEIGIDTIVTDHHLPEAEMPPAFAILNPNRPDCNYPNKNLCGAGVTLKLVQALLESSGMTASRRAALLDSFLKPVAIATVADVVPLLDENRAIVQRGLSGLRRVRNIGMRALLAVAGFDDGECPSAHQVAFRLAPRINAAGRMATARDVIELFLTEDGDRATQLAEQLDLLNRERQNAENEIVQQILAECEQTPFAEDCAALVFTGTDWHAGVLGIVASRLVERFSRPAFVLTNSSYDGQDCISGSGRSVAAFHLLEGLENMQDLFLKFGGHRQAAGITLPAHRLAEFRERFDTFARTRLRPEDLSPQITIDAEACLPELNDRCVQDVFSLGPFGYGNPSPVFLARRAIVAGMPQPLKDGKHFNVGLRQNGRLLFAKAWDFADRSDLITSGNALDIVFQIEDDPFGRKRGYGSWQISIKDVRPAAE